MSTNNKIQQVSIAQSVSKNFVDYAMSVITERALPDANDGFKTCTKKNSIRRI